MAGILAFIAALLGIWAVAAPFVFPWDVCPWVWVANIIPGIVAALLGLVFSARPRKGLAWLLWLAFLVGIWLVVSPFIAGYAIVFDVLWANFLPGGLIAILCAIAGFMALQSE
jgi:hypothetical protein